MFVGPRKSLTRTSAFVWKEVVEVVRRPGALFSLVLGPFFIMGLFGIGYSGQRRPLETVLVVPTTADLPREASFYQEYVGQAVVIRGVVDNAEAARRDLAAQRIDMLIIAPGDVEARFRAGEQSVIGVEYNQIDPVRDNYARFIAYRQVQELNRVILERIVGSGQRYAVQLGAEQATAIPAEVIAAPTRAETRNLAPIEPNVVAYFAPAVLALVLQHMAISLTALSMVRERMSGAMDVFRVAPVRTLEVVVGKYVAYGFFNLSIATATTLLVVRVLGVPLLGAPYELAWVVLLLTAASLGMGLLISNLVDSERGAVQFSMLVLLASVFFSGFVLPLDEFLPQVQWFAYTLPVTHGIRLLQDTMLMGGTNSPWQQSALAIIAVIMFLLTSFTLRRSLRPA